MTYYRILSLIATISVLFLWCNPAEAQSSGATYYIAPWGNNHNSGSSPQSPWGNIGYAVSQMHAGDTLLVRGGIYSNQGFTIATGVGTPSNPVRIQAYPGEVPVFTGSEPYGGVGVIQSSAVIDGLHIEDFTNVNDAVDIWGSYVTIQNCTFKSIPYQFIRLMGADHVTIQNNYFDGNGQLQDNGQGDAIFAGSATNVLVQNNYDTRAGHYFFDAMALPGGGSQGSQIIVRDNTIQSFWGGGIAFGSAQNLVFENNRLSHVGEGVPYIKSSFEIVGPTAIVRNNVMTQEAGWYGDPAMGIAAEDNGGTQDAVHNRVYNNTFYKNGYLPVFESQRFERDLSDNRVNNNILYYNETGGSTFYSPAKTSYIGIETYHAYASCPTGSPNCSNYVWTQFPNNNYFQNNIILHSDAFGDHPGAATVVYTPNTSVGGWTIAGFSDTVASAQANYGPFIAGNIEQNPEFVAPDLGNFELQPSSPAISAGTHLAHTTASGAATNVIPVDDAYAFTDGYGMIPGDVVLIGANLAVSITTVNTANSTLTVSSPVTFLNGDPVDLADHNGSAPDIGAFPFGATPPVVSGVSASVINATTAVITWMVSSGDTTQVEFGLTTEYGQTSLANTTAQANGTITLNGLWPNTTYHYAVISANGRGGRTISQDGAFTTFAASGPVISNISVSGISSTGATIAWTTDIPGNSQLFYSAPDRKYTWNHGYVNSSPISDSSGVLNHSVSITGLLPNTLYHFAVQSTDANGETSFSADYTFITQALPSNGPVISNISISTSAGPAGWFAGIPGQNFAPAGMNCCGYSYAQATFSWATNKPTSQNKVLIIPTVGGGYLQSAELDSSTAVPVSGDPSPTTTPSLTVYQLAPNTTYVYMVESTDSGGHTTVSPNYEFTTPSTDVSDAGVSNPQAQQLDSGIPDNSVQQLALGMDGTTWGLNSAGEIFSYDAQTQTWSEIAGALKQISVGSDGSVWGINAAGSIYRWDTASQSWDWIGGNLSQIAVGADGDVWGLNIQNQIYHFNQALQNWTNIPGSLEQVAVGFDSAVWGVNAAHQVYRFNPGTGLFEGMTGSLTQVAVGADGDVWGLNHDGIYHFDRLTQNWNRTGGTLSQISVGTGNNVWGLGAGGQIYSYDAPNNNWLSVAGTLARISAAANGSVWAVDTKNHVYQFIEPTQPVNTLHQIPGTLVQIAAGLDGSVWGINSLGQIFSYDSPTQSWTWIPGSLSQIAVGNANSVWGLNYANQIYRFDPVTTSWRNVPGTLAHIAVGGNGDVWGINSANYIYRFDAASQSWQWIPGFLQQISVGVDGAAWGLSGQRIYRFDLKAQTWVQTPGTLQQIAVGSSNNVWGLNSEGSAYRFDPASEAWIYVPGIPLTQIAVGFDGAVWGLNSANQIFEYSAQTQSWIQVNGALAQIAVAADAVVWGLDASGSIYMYR